MVQRMPLWHPFCSGLYSGQERVLGQISGPGGPLQDLQDSSEQESICAFHCITSVWISDP